MPKSPQWKAVDKLVSEQKLEEASAIVETIRKEAQASSNDDDWTRALVKRTQLRIALGGWETAVAELRAAPWPPSAQSKTVLDLYYAHALLSYLQGYSWEIAQRERVQTRAGAVELKSWTRDQIVAEVQRTWSGLWRRRAELGSVKLGVLSEYVRANNYPERIRGTVRDAISYLAVQLLADSQYWRPEESNETFRLPFAALLKGGDSRSRSLALDDAGTHPLVRMAAVLDDLEGWHAGAGHKEAALEARLERLRRLHAAFSQESERQAVRAHLESLLPRVRGLEWWAMAQAELAQMVRDDTADLVRARALAAEGAKAYPQALGGQRCLHLQKSIEAPDFQMESMASDAPGKRSVRIVHRNLGQLHFRAYPFDLVQRVESATDWRLLHDQDELKKMLAAAAPKSVAWTVQLPGTPDYQSHATYVTPPAGVGRGAWVLLSSARPDFREEGNRVLAAHFLVSDIALFQRNDEDGAAEVRVVSGSTGKPLSGAQVDLYRFDYQKGHRRAASKKADAEGLVRFTESNLRSERHSYFLLARAGNEVTLDGNQFSLSRPAKPEATRAALVYTDRSIYRPLQKLYFKVVAYRGRPDEARLQVQSGAKLTVTLHDPNDQKVATAAVTTNAYGSAAGEMTIPAGRLLGGWTLRSSVAGQAEFRVEEYKRPTFEVSFKDPDQPLRLNRAAVLKGEARYYFGLPVTAGSVKWRVVRQPVYPWWWGHWGHFRPGRGIPGGGGGASETQTIATGTAKLGSDGMFELRFTPAADERQKDLSYRYAVSADLTDEGGETRSAERSFRLGFTTVEATLSREKGFFRANDRGEVSIRRTSLDGVARPGAGQWRLLALQTPAKAVMPAEMPVWDAAPGAHQTPGDKLRPRWPENFAPEAEIARFLDGQERARGEVRHGQDGNSKVTLPALPAGAYRLRYETADDFGQKFTTWHDFIVASDAPPLGLPLVMLAESSSVNVGGRARLMIATGLGDQTVFFQRFRAGKVIDERRVGQGKPAILEIPVEEADRGGFAVTVTAVRDHQAIRLDQAIHVPWDDRELKLSFSTFRDKMRPGAKETFRVSVKNHAGKPVEAGAAELLAYMYDRSLDIFAGHAPPSPLSLLPFRGQVPWVRGSLGPASVQPLYWSELHQVPAPPALQGDALFAEDAYGIGGMGARQRRMGVMPPSPMAAAPQRSELRRESKAANEYADKELVEMSAAKVKAPAVPPPADVPPPGQGHAAQQPAGGQPPQVRSNFAETAFFRPQLLTDKDGTAALEFTVPDSVTSWNVWVHAVTKDLRGGSHRAETRSVKDLMVRPYLPRFFREGDQAQLKVVVNNAGASKLSGVLKLEIIDPQTQKSKLELFEVKTTEGRFSVDQGKSANLTFALKAPRAVGQYAVRVVATAGSLSDGELRPVPVLPSRMHLIQSRFVTLRDADRRVMKFDDLAKGDDPTRVNDQLVVNLDAQLFYTVLKALPYLIKYPYECTEQTLNRFVSTGIVTSLFNQYPAVSKMAREMSKRQTQFQPFDQQDPNRKMAQEETPWLQEARGGSAPSDDLIDVLHPGIAQATRDDALAKLKKAQTSNGAFPWFPGGPPSPFMTLYIMHGFAKAAEFGVDVPKDVVQRGWQYLAKYVREEIPRWMGRDCCWELLTFLNYVASAYPDASYARDALTLDERKKILAFSFKHWKEHTPYLKGYLSLTLKRMGREKDARLVFQSVMDSAKTKPDEGTFWQPEDRSWLWYQDTIESHAFALRTLTELEPKHQKRDGLVLWLLLNKKMNQWKSTRATAEVIYSLAHYMKKEETLGIREEAAVAVGPRTQSFVFEPDKYLGKAQLVIPGTELGTKHATVSVDKKTKGVMFASATWHFSTDKLPAEGRGDFFRVARSYFKRENDGRQWVLKPLAEGTRLDPGDQIEVQLSLQSKHAAEYVHLRDPRAAGLEPENAVSRWKWDLGLAFYEETRDSGANFFFEQLPAGQYTFKYRLRANMAGTFRVGPATVQSMYAPEFAAYSAGHTITVR